MCLIPSWIRIFFDWFRYYRKGKIKYEVYKLQDIYVASASNGEITVLNCIGNTPEEAKEIANFKLLVAIENSKNKGKIINTNT